MFVLSALLSVNALITSNSYAITNDGNKAQPFPGCPRTATPTATATLTPTHEPTSTATATTEPTNTPINTEIPTATQESPEPQPTIPPTEDPAPTPTVDPGPSPTSDPTAIPTEVVIVVPKTGNSSGNLLLMGATILLGSIAICIFLVFKNKKKLSKKSSSQKLSS